MKYINNPFDLVIQATEILYPGTKALIQFNPNIKYRKFLWFTFGYCGHTIFPDDGSTPLIDISTNIPFEAMVEILAHELSHVVAGRDADHNENWENVFSNILNKYMELLEDIKEEFIN